MAAISAHTLGITLGVLLFAAGAAAQAPDDAGPPATSSADGAAAPIPVGTAAAPEAAMPPVASSSTPAVASTPLPPLKPPARPKINRLLLGGGALFGFFNPDGVNTYLKNWVEAQHGYTTQGTPHMLLHVGPRAAVVFSPIPYIDITVLGELAWAPKVATLENGTGKSTYFSYTRLSGGALANIHIPLREQSIFFGGGVLYSKLAFEEYTAETPGFRVQVGTRIPISNTLAVDGFLAFDSMAKDTGKPMNAGRNSRPDGSYTIGQTPGTMTLSYTAIVVGGTVYVGLLP